MKRQRGFTLIELLIVIAIIAILVAILVPVFFKVKESTRQGTSMSNLKQIGQGLAQYKLDNHRCPDVLFGYADGGGTMNAYKPAVSMAAYPLSLYPSYVKTAGVFQDPNNTAKPDDASAVTGSLTPGATPQPTPPLNAAHTYFTADAYDVCPQVTAASTLSTTYVARYTPRWTALGAVGTDAGRQLQAPNPPGDTYVTCTTYHVPNADKVLVLFENGSVKKMTGADFSALEPNNGFWTVKP